MLIYQSPAKINLSLDVLSRRDDGYHELQSVVHCVGLYDTISIDMSGSPGLSLRCSDAALSGDENLCLKAARAWLQTAKTLEGKRSGFPGIRLTLDKKIPVGAGLGGGSGNAAATLLALNQYFETPLSHQQLCEVAAKLGADVPLFLNGGCSLIEGIGEKLTQLSPLEGWVVLIHPPQHASTPAVYGRFDQMNTSSNQSTLILLQKMKSGNIADVAPHLGNDLQAAAESLGIDAQLPTRLMKEHGALNAQMTGSGSASFGLFETESAARAARAAIQGVPELPQNYRVSAAPLIAGGVEQLDS